MRVWGYLNGFQTSAPDGGGGVVSFMPGQEPTIYPVNRKQSGPEDRCGHSLPAYSLVNPVNIVATRLSFGMGVQKL
jgi:hypothetical protein